MKVDGSYASVTRGVSEQVPQDRRPGQHHEQVNMISDPVRGLVRRHGSRFLAESTTAGDVSDFAARLADTGHHKVFPFRIDDREYDLIYRTKAVDSSYPYKLADSMWVYNKTEQRFESVFYTAAVTAFITSLVTGGVSAVASVGRYVLLAGASITPAYSEVDFWSNSANQALMGVWVRAGAYARKFKVNFIRSNGDIIEVEYETPSASYPGILDTSDIRTELVADAGGTTDVVERYILSSPPVTSPTDPMSGYPRIIPEYSWARTTDFTITHIPTSTVLTLLGTTPGAIGDLYQYRLINDELFFNPLLSHDELKIQYTRKNTVTNSSYQKQVNDRVNDYNGQVTSWISYAAKAISPESIVTSLIEAATAKFALLGVTALMTGFGAHLRIYSASNSFVEVSVDDTGDNALMRAIGNVVTSVDHLSPKHVPGKHVKVRPKKADGKDAFYMCAYAKEGIDPLTNDFVDVSWREAPGTYVTPTSVLGIMTRKADGTIVLGMGKADLDPVLGVTDTPKFAVSQCGDTVTHEVPRFLKNKITYLGLFQDRLLIGSGAAIFMSKPGDYFNWFSASALTVADDDPIEVLEFGSEGDVIRASTSYDRNIVFFGDKKQYSISGRQAITPKNATILSMSAHEDATDANPVSSGNFVFYARQQRGAASLHQIQTGLVADSPESYEVTQQLDRYLVGTPVQIVPMTSPNHIFLRTDGYRNGLYVYTYLDSAAGQERLFDSWSRWEWDERVGHTIGVSNWHGDLLVYTMKQGKSNDGIDRIWIAAEKFDLNTELDDKPCLDSLRNVSAIPTTGYLNTQTDTEGVSAAFDMNSQRFLIGVPLDRLSELDVLSSEFPHLWMGFDYTASVTPTNPYPRDRNDKAIINGRLTLVKISVSVAQTGGIVGTVTTSGGTKETMRNLARVLGFGNNLVGRQPYSDYTASMLVGREVRECTYTLSSINWLPLTVTAIEYTGQLFNNAKRI